MVEALKRSGKEATRDAVPRALDSVREYEMGGYVVTFSPTKHNGSKFVDLTILGRPRLQELTPVK